MSWWSKLRNGFGGEPKSAPEKPRADPAEWLALGDPGNPFDVPILDLMSNLSVTSTTKNLALAERSMSWRAGQHDRLAWTLDGERFRCDLHYDAATISPRWDAVRSGRNGGQMGHRLAARQDRRCSELDRCHRGHRRSSPGSGQHASRA